MIKVSYRMLAKGPLHTGSDTKAGIAKLLRRQKISLVNPVEIESSFNSDQERRETIVQVLEIIWKHIDFADMGSSRKLGIWDEFASKVDAATRCRTRYQFLNEICSGFDIRSVRTEQQPDIGILLERFNDDEFLSTIRDELQYLIILLRRNRDTAKGKTKAAETSVVNRETPNLVFVKTFEHIPFFSGNSIRGILRRLVMHDFCEKVGITRLDKSRYHQLFTGGNINDSTRYEDIDYRERYINMCPMVGLFGSAIGNMTIQGSLLVSHAHPICVEHGDGDVSFWEYVSSDFGTRRDDSKIEKDVEIRQDISEDKSPNQMLYRYEVLVDGTPLSHQFVCVSSSPLLQSSFWRALELFKEKPFIGGMSSVGMGCVELEYEVPTSGSILYLAHLEEKKEEIRKYFSEPN